MTPAAPKKRPTARELARRYGMSERTVRRMVGRPRDEFLAERRALRTKAAALRATGMMWAEVGEALGVTAASARALAKRATGEWSSGSATDDRDPNTPDLFEDPKP